MPFNQPEFNAALEQYDQANVDLQCNEFVGELYCNPDGRTIDELKDMMQALRSKRMFKAMQRLGDACMQTGKTSFRIRRQFAQALIENGIYTAALAVLKDLREDTDNDPNEAHENAEAYGLTGRVYKQLYVNTESTGHDVVKGYLQKAFNAYWKIYYKDRNKLYHGINAVAVMARAAKDNIDLQVDPKPDIPTDKLVEAIARDLIEKVKKLEDNEDAKAFDLATAVEACVAQQDYKEGIRWAEKYIKRSATDAFELASTLRQLVEVWEADRKGEEALQLVTLLRGALLKKEGGTIVLRPGELQDGVGDKQHSTGQAEKVFGQDSYQTYEWYIRGSACCLPIARIGREKLKGFGTGFLMDGGDLHPDWINQIVLLTNAHVVTNDEQERAALRPADALILFEVMGLDKTFQVKELHFTSPYKELDVTILGLMEEDQAFLREQLVKRGSGLFKLASGLPPKDKARVYIIGHPAGGTLQLSLQDNALLDYEGRLLHYRTPTVGGSSGSPLFNDQWELIGIHHAGGNYMRKLNNQRGMYQANEGIWIRSIIEAIREKRAKQE